MTADDITAAYNSLLEEADAQAEKREAELVAPKPTKVSELFEMLGKPSTQIRCGCIGFTSRGVPRVTSGLTAVWKGQTYDRCECGKTYRYNRVTG